MTPLNVFPLYLSRYKRPVIIMVKIGMAAYINWLAEAVVNSIPNIKKTRLTVDNREIKTSFENCFFCQTLERTKIGKKAKAAKDSRRKRIDIDGTSAA